MHAELPGAALALVAGHGVVGARLPLGEAIERGVRLLRERTAPGDHAGEELRLDEVVAGLLDARFDVGADERGLFLRGERDVVDATRTLLGRETTFVGRDL